jgi:hypothetical protein
MRLWLLLIGILIAAAARADEFSDFNAAVESFSAHNRAALRYLHDDAVGPMSGEIDEMRAAWAAVNGRFGRPPQQLAADIPLYTTTLVDISMRLVGASMFIQMGSRGGVKNSLTAIRTDLSALRKANGVSTLADCVLEANEAMTALLAAGNEVASDWTRSAELTAEADKYTDIVTRCEAMAPSGDSRLPSLVAESRKLLAGMPRAIAAHDAAQLRQVLDRLRDNDDALAFRYG